MPKESLKEIIRRLQQDQEFLAYQLKQCHLCPYQCNVQARLIHLQEDGCNIRPVNDDGKVVQ